jgi:tetratricopeptide (TPR) repeat protein
MRRIATLTFLLALAGAVLAGGPDDDFLVIYSQIQKADALQKGGQLPAAAVEYLHARDALQKLHADFPASNPAAVNYRLDYLEDKLKELAAYLPSGGAAPAAAKPAVPLTPQQQAAMWQEEIRALTNANAELEMKLKEAHVAQQQAAMLQERNSELTNANAKLEMKLKEALSVQPAAVAPGELAKARERITELEKERDLLSVALEQAKAAKSGAKPSASNTDSAKPNAEVADIMYNFTMPAEKVLTEIYAPLVGRTALEAAAGPTAIDRGALITLHTPSPVTKSTAIKALETVMAMNGIAVVPVGDTLFKVVPTNLKSTPPPERPVADNVKQLTAERDQLKKERDDLKKQVAALKPSPPSLRTAAPATGSGAELEGLRARLAALEAAPVPYTAEEQAVLKSSPSARPPAAPVAAKEPSPKVHSVQDLSVSQTTIMKQAWMDAEARRYDEAEKEYLEVLRQDESNIYVLAKLGGTEFAAGRLDDCEKNVRRALALDPNDPGALYLLGILRYRQEKMDEALNALSRSAALNSTNEATQFYLGNVLAAKGLRPEAETALRKALEIDPAYADAHFSLALVYAGEKPPALALARWHYQKAIDNGHEKSDKLEKMLSEGK